MIDLPTGLFNDLVSAIAADLKAEGYVVNEDYDFQLHVYRMEPPAVMPRAAMLPLIRERAVVYLDAFAAAEPVRFGRRAALEAADDLRAEERTGKWLRMLFEYIRDELPEIDADTATALRRSASPHESAPRTRPASYFANLRASKRDAALDRARGVIAKWLAGGYLPDGKHTFAELWDQWQATILPLAATKAPELADLGRNGFYAALSDVADVHTTSGRTRYIIVTKATPE